MCYNNKLDWNIENNSWTKEPIIELISTEQYELYRAKERSEFSLWFYWVSPYKMKPADHLFGNPDYQTLRQGSEYKINENNIFHKETILT